MHRLIQIRRAIKLFPNQEPALEKSIRANRKAWLNAVAYLRSREKYKFDSIHPTKGK